MKTGQGPAISAGTVLQCLMPALHWHTATNTLLSPRRRFLGCSAASLEPRVCAVGGAVAAAEAIRLVAAPLATQHLIIQPRHIAQPRIACAGWEVCRFGGAEIRTSGYG